MSHQTSAVNVGDRRILKASALSRTIPPEVTSMQEDVQRAVGSDTAVLITAGSDREAWEIAESIHRLSLRRSGPFLHMDMRTVAAQATDIFDRLGIALMNASASDRRSTGTLFLSHIEAMTPALQNGLMRFLDLCDENGRSSVRIIASTDQLVFTRVQARQIRPDLFGRLNTVHIITYPHARPA